MICFSKYKDHDIDEDPIIVLPCEHFFATSTLDGCLDLTSVYETSTLGNYVGLKTLRGSAVSEKPRQCSECRSIIHSVRRYGRYLRLVELRSLERKHLMMVNHTVASISKKVENEVDQSTLKALDKV